MAYNNFPVSYQPMYYQNQMQQPIMQNPPIIQSPIQMSQPQMSTSSQPVNNSIQWVQGLAGAKSYLVAPNTTVQLWDSEAPVVYLKSADASGMPSIKILDYTVRDNSANTVPMIENSGYSMMSDNNMSRFNSPTDTDIVDGVSKTIDINDYATKDDIESIRNQIDDVKNTLNSLEQNSQSRRNGGNDGNNTNNSNNSNGNNNNYRNK